jgi:hypothetical protein
MNASLRPGTGHTAMEGYSTLFRLVSARLFFTSLTSVVDAEPLRQEQVACCIPGQGGVRRLQAQRAESRIGRTAAQLS